MNFKIALAGNPNSGKTTLFNTLTGSNQFVGNWPGVTVEKKEGKLRKHNNVTITDLPGIYSLSPYTLEEVVARNYLIGQRPHVILNIIDGTNLERNLYLTTQLLELGIPVVVALNMMDLVRKNGDVINTEELSRQLGCSVVEISALKGSGIEKLTETALKAAAMDRMNPMHRFDGAVEHAIAHIEEAAVHEMPEHQQRWYAIKIFERDDKVLDELKLTEETISHIEKDITSVERQMDDDSESIITNERYLCIGKFISACYKKKNKGALSTSDRIDKVVTNRWLGLPIFAIVMFLVYYIAMSTVGDAATTWTNDNLFGDGFHITGGSKYTEALEEYGEAVAITEGYNAVIDETGMAPEGEFNYQIEDEETLEIITETASIEDYNNAIETLERYDGEPEPEAYGIFVPGIPAIVESGLDALNCAGWLKGLVLDGIVAGVGAVLGFVPQMLILFFMLAILEICGYMARIAFVLDRIFRKIGLSGKSFIPMLVGMGCGVPGVMASRTIENERDRRMTVMTTTFIPCGAKIPFIAMIAGAIFGGAAWVATAAYFIGMGAIIVSGIMLKKTKMFAGEPAPFVMELPAYHLPTLKNILRSTWERGWSFIKKAGTIILISTIVIWFTSFFGFTEDGLRMLSEDELDMSILASIGGTIAWIFIPLGWGNWQAAVASITGLVAKENIVGTMGILYGSDGNAWAAIGSEFTAVTGLSFLVFNLLCAPCFAAIGAIKREMNNTKWTWFAIGYQCGFAYIVALMIAQFGNMIAGNGNVIGVIAAVIALAAIIYMLVRPYRESTYGTKNTQLGRI